MMLELKRLQDQVDSWIKEYGVNYFDEMTNTALLMEEVGELARLMARMYGQQSFKVQLSKDEQHQQLADEMADVLFVLTCLANQTNTNLTTAMQENLEKKTNRDTDRHRSNPHLKSDSSS